MVKQITELIFDQFTDEDGLVLKQVTKSFESAINGIGL